MTNIHICLQQNISKLERTQFQKNINFYLVIPVPVLIPVLIPVLFPVSNVCREPETIYMFFCYHLLQFLIEENLYFISFISSCICMCHLQICNRLNTGVKGMKGMKGTKGTIDCLCISRYSRFSYFSLFSDHIMNHTVAVFYFI